MCSEKRLAGNRSRIASGYVDEQLCVYACMLVCVCIFVCLCACVCRLLCFMSMCKCGWVGAALDESRIAVSISHPCFSVPCLCHRIQQIMKISPE